MYGNIQMELQSLINGLQVMFLDQFKKNNNTNLWVGYTLPFRNPTVPNIDFN